MFSPIFTAYIWAKPLSKLTLSSTWRTVDDAECLVGSRKFWKSSHDPISGGSAKIPGSVVFVVAVPEALPGWHINQYQFPSIW
jgi:hypothetical protein